MCRNGKGCFRKREKLAKVQRKGFSLQGAHIILRESIRRQTAKTLNMRLKVFNWESLKLLSKE